MQHIKKLDFRTLAASVLVSVGAVSAALDSGQLVQCIDLARAVF